MVAGGLIPLVDTQQRFLVQRTRGVVRVPAVVSTNRARQIVHLTVEPSSLIRISVVIVENPEVVQRSAVSSRSWRPTCPAVLDQQGGGRIRLGPS